MAKNIFISAIVAIVVSLGVGTMIMAQPVDKLGGTVENFPVNFVNGLTVGTSQTTFVDSSRAITVTGITNSGSTTTTGDTTVTGDVFGASGSFTGKFQVGGTTASSSSTFVAEIQSGTATTSVLFGGTGSKGLCIKAKDSAGVWRYGRLIANTLTFNTTACY